MTDDVSKTESPEEEARRIVAQMVSDASAELAEMESQEHVFAMLSECKDKDGNETKVLKIDLDKDGFLGMYRRLRQPVTLGGEGMIVNDEKVDAYLQFMSNIDLTDKDNLKAVGMSALGKASDTVAAFFTLRRAADMSPV